ncbi:MAG: DVU0772 family protein [Syntrophobacteraceae bacterium]
MWGLEELKGHREILDRIDWDMTPEKAVETFLEWGTGWTRKDDFVRHHSQDAVYFVIYDWEKPPQVTLIQRSVQDANEIAKIPAPPDIIRRAIEEGGRKPGVGVYALTDEVKDWLRETLNC